MTVLQFLFAVSYTHLDVYKRQVKYVKRNMWINSLLNLSNNSVNFIVVWCNGSTKDFGSFSTPCYH